MLRAPRSISLGLLTLAALLAAPLAAPNGAGTLPAAQALDATPNQAAGTAPALSVEQARAAARRILAALQSGDAQARFAQFSPEMQAITSPSMIAATMRTQPRVLSYELLSVRSGLNNSIVEAELRTQAGNRVVFMVLNRDGRIERYYLDRSDDKNSLVALQFVKAVSTGHFITAHSFLAPDLQKEITPASLQSKWQELQKQTGQFVQVGRAVEAERSKDSQLVLVNVQFNRLSDNLFVILNSSNQIVGLDFPEILTGPASVR
ncbi:MAG: DUF3887 domain-containing protein [Synechococcaceae bacterium WB9_2_112]|nr:DUF3887 domain-containing protein [Synechococcaceae bacterium WB9_2_112]